MIDDRHRRIGVYGLAVHDGCVLLARIAPEYSAPMAWTLPGGGMEYGEAPREALAREFHEETGLDAEIHCAVLVRSRVFDRLGPALHSLQVVYGVTATGDPRPEQGGSTIDARWVSLRDVGSLDVVPLVEAALDLVDR